MKIGDRGGTVVKALCQMHCATAVFRKPAPLSRYSKIVPFYEIVWKSNVDLDRLQMSIWRMRIAYWIPKTINTVTEFVILVAFPLQQRL
jgi:hypothetical protein